MAEANGTSNCGSLTPNAVSLIIDGKDVVGPNRFSVKNPTNGEEVWQAGGASLSNVTQVVDSAQAAFKTWSKKKPAFRRDVFLRAAQHFEQRRLELMRIQKDETGAEEAFMQWILNVTIEDLKGVAARCMGITGSIIESEHEGRAGLVFREPYGVVLSIAPWNAPWPLGCRGVAYALAAGNTVILKGSELSPRCYYEIASIFRESGLPDGCLNLLFHRREDSAEITNALIAHPSIKKINFTGSTAIGSVIAATAGKHLKPLVTELGGKASTIVLADADIEKAAKSCTLNSFLHAGQVCMSTDRVIIHSSIVGDFIEAFKRSTDDMYGGQDCRPRLVSAEGAIKTKTLVKDAIDKGANVVFGDPKESLELDRSSTSMAPIILSAVSKSADLYLAESFGPSVALFTFETEEEALEIANDCEYGLSGAVFTENLAAGLRIARGYETGGVHINSLSIHQEAGLPHGGFKRSGFGSSTGQAAMDEYLRRKVVTFDD